MKTGRRPLAAAAVLAGAGLAAGDGSVFAAGGSVFAAGARAAETAAQRGPRLEVEPEEWDFGNAGPGETLEHDFVLKNTGNRELVLGRIASACACAAAVVGTEALPPGAETLLRVTLETRQYRGILERWLTITSNDRRGAKRVKLRVYIEDRPTAATAAPERSLARGEGPGSADRQEAPTGEGCGEGPPPRERRRGESRSDSRRRPVGRAPRREPERGLLAFRWRNGGRGAFSTGRQRPTMSRYAQFAASAASPAASAARPARNQGGVFRRTSSAPVAASQP